MARTILSTFLLTLASTLAGSEDRTLQAKYLVTVTDDFIVDVYHNGRYVPDSKRALVLERFGATAERIDVEVRDGDWLVFNVVNNRLRWGGASYFAVAGCFATNEFGFVSRLDTSDWSACDDPSRVDRFISERKYLQHRRAHGITRPWHEGTKFMRQHAGSDWDGTPLWGTKRNTWIKVLVGETNTDSPRRSAGDELVTRIEGTSWLSSPEGHDPLLTFRTNGVVQGASAATLGRWYAIRDRIVVAEWKSQIYVIVFEKGMETAQLYRKGQRLSLTRRPRRHQLTLPGLSRERRF